MIVTTTSQSAPQYAVTVRRTRLWLRSIFWIVLISGFVATVLGFLAAQDTLQRYEAIVADSAASADAAQAAREAVLAFHSETALALAQRSNEEAVQSTAQADVAWTDYQEAVRQLWDNRSDITYGEYALFNATDVATLRYRAAVDGMTAFAANGDGERTTQAFLTANRILGQELLPPLNRIEQLKLESMEVAYDTTSSAISRWQILLLFAGGLLLLALILAWATSRFSMHYRWTWQLILSLLLGIPLLIWFVYTLGRASDDVEVMVRGAYDTISVTQSTTALLTQAQALQSMALFAPESQSEFLSDAREYQFLVEQQLCGDRNCTDESFLDSSTGEISNDAYQAGLQGLQTYGLSRPPLVNYVDSDRFPNQAATLEELGRSVARMREGQVQLESGDASGALAGRAAYISAIDNANTLTSEVRSLYDRLYDSTVLEMKIDRVGALLFAVLAVVGAWGIQRRYNDLQW